MYQVLQVIRSVEAVLPGPKKCWKICWHPSKQWIWVVMKAGAARKKNVLNREKSFFFCRHYFLEVKHTFLFFWMKICGWFFSLERCGWMVENNECYMSIDLGGCFFFVSLSSICTKHCCIRAPPTPGFQWKVHFFFRDLLAKHVMSSWWWLLPFGGVYLNYTYVRWSMMKRATSRSIFQTQLVSSFIWSLTYVRKKQVNTNH